MSAGVVGALLWAGLGVFGDREPPPVMWMGHQIVRGQRELPLLGVLHTRTDTWVLAEVRRTNGATLEIRERACRVRVAETAGAHISIGDAAVRRLPPVSMRYRLSAERQLWLAGPWRAGWGPSDHDGDGHPGLSVKVDAPLCGGRGCDS